MSVRAPVAAVLVLPLLLVPAALSGQARSGAVPGAGDQAAVAGSLRAQPAEGAIAVDGRLDEPAWTRAEALSDFLQLEPDEGAAPSFRTEIRVVFDAAGVYVGAHLYDDQPDQVMATLGRRDDVNRADWIIVSIDSYFDRKTAYVFGVNAAGVQYDGVMAGGGGFGGGGFGGGGGGGGGGPGGGGGGGRGGGDDVGDRSWDAIWESSVQRTADGWTAEMHIPYSMLRFSNVDPQTWGVQFSRRIPRLGEVAEWPFVRRTERSNLVTRFGVLEGIRGVEPRRAMQLTPYTVSKLDVTESEDEPGTSSAEASADAGVDLKVGLGSAFTLNATVNPDFGQVESDPAELNLTAFETTFPEVRPFFVEGSQFYNFQTGPGNLVYTRRIGASAPIIGAAKLSGRTAGGLQLGVLGASTGDDWSPERSYGIVRATKEIGAFSTAGAAVTLYDSLTSLGDRRSVAGGVDVDLRSPGNRYQLQSFVAYSHRMLLDGENQSGFATNLRGAKRQGALTYNVLVDAFHNDFNPVDLGQLRNGDFYTLILGGNYQLNGGRPFGAFQRANVGTNIRQQWTFRDRLDRGLNIGLNSGWTLRGFQTVFLMGGVTFSGYDPFQTRGLGPRLAPRSVRFGGSFSTDDRKPWNVRPDFNADFDENGGRRLRAGIGTRWNASPRVQLSANVNADFERDIVDWASNESFRLGAQGWEIGTLSRAPSRLADDEWVPVADQGRIAEILTGVAPYDAQGRYYLPVFGARSSRTLDTTLRSSLTFTRTLDFSFYGQLFLARARYDDFALLRDRDHHAAFANFPKSNEFARNRFQFNSVLRWEYRPGSTVYVVWTQGRSADDRLDPLVRTGPSPYDTPLSRQVGDTFELFPRNVFLIKVNYAFLN